MPRGWRQSPWGVPQPSALAAPASLALHGHGVPLGLPPLPLSSIGCFVNGLIPIFVGPGSNIVSQRSTPSSHAPSHERRVWLVLAKPCLPGKGHNRALIGAAIEAGPSRAAQSQSGRSRSDHLGLAESFS